MKVMEMPRAKMTLKEQKQTNILKTAMCRHYLLSIEMSQQLTAAGLQFFDSFVASSTSTMRAVLCVNVC